MSEKITVTLSQPHEFRGQAISEIAMRKPKVRDLRQMDETKGGNVSKVIALVANLGEVEPELLEDLPALEFERINEALAPFLSGRTG